MSVNQSRQVVSEYFNALESGHFSRFFTDDVTWTTITSGIIITGPQAVQEAIKGLHARLLDLETRQLVVADQAAYIEGSGVAATHAGRVAYCVAYDIVGDRIAAMRAYGAIAELMPPLS